MSVGEPILMSDLPFGSTSYLDGDSRWMVGYEVVVEGDKTVRYAVRISFTELSQLLRGGVIQSGGVSSPSSSAYQSLGSSLKVVAMDDLGRLSSAATASSVYIVGYLHEKGQSSSFIMSVATLGVYLKG